MNRQPRIRRIRYAVACALISASLSMTSAAAKPSPLSPQERDARKIMTAVNERDDGDRIIFRMVMLIKDGLGRTRKRVATSRLLDFDSGTKQLILFEAPADVRNTGLLSIDYSSGEKDDDQWLYLPSLRKSTRISSSDKSGAFMGSDLSYADMTDQDPKSYRYKMLDTNATVAGESCWKIEARPATDKAKRETGYVKSVVWVSKKKTLPLQVKNWIREGKRLKYIKFGEQRQIEGVWVTHLVVAQTRRGKNVQSTTIMRLADYKLNQASVRSSDFNQRRLEKGL